LALQKAFSPLQTHTAKDCSVSAPFLSEFIPVPRTIIQSSQIMHHLFSLIIVLVCIHLESQEMAFNSILYSIYVLPKR
jgi:hypothetical protein